MKVKINGRQMELEVDKRRILLDFLREDLGLTGVKRGCEIGECGACMVLINKKAVNSCMVLVGQVENCEITTIEGISEETLIPLQEKLINGGAVQCGYCTPGMIMAILSLLYENPSPSGEEVRRAIDGNLCRCTGYNQIIDSVVDMNLDEVKLSLSIEMGGEKC